MDRKIDAGALIVALAATLLAVSLFLDWFGLGDGNGITAWEAFEVLDLVLLAAAIAAVASAFGFLDKRVLIGAALVAVVVVVSQLVQPPPAGQGAEREIGAWLGLVAALGLLLGAALAAAQIAVTVDVRGRERRRRVATVDKRTPAASPAASSPEERTISADRFAPDSAVRVRNEPPGSQTTQAFAAQPEDDPAR